MQCCNVWLCTKDKITTDKYVQTSQREVVTHGIYPFIPWPLDLASVQCRQNDRVTTNDLYYNPIQEIATLYFGNFMIIL